MSERKIARMQPFASELEAAGIEYQPFAISCWGRLHPAALQMLSRLAKRMARREGTSCHRAVLQRLMARITTLVMRRAARMALRCLPQAACDDAEEWPSCDALLSSPIALRAGDPSTSALEPFLVAPPCGAAPSA
jgi:hypothetical protein